MKNICTYLFLLALLIGYSDVSHAQGDARSLSSVTSRDTIRLNNKIRDLIERDYLVFLNTITSTNDPFDDYDVAEMIKERCTTMFAGADVRVENDVIPGSDTMSVPSDLKIVDYLWNFRNSLVHSESPAVFFDELTISPLKFSDDIGFYCDIYLDCKMKAKYKLNDQEYPPVYGRRITVEVRREKDSWRPRILQISFHKGEKDDITNLFNEIEEVPVNPEDILNEDKRNTNRIKNVIEQKRQERNEAIEEGDRLFISKSYQMANNKYSLAKQKQIDMTGLGAKEKSRLSEIKDKIQQVLIALEDSSNQVQSVDRLQKLALWEFTRFNFEASSILLDSIQDVYKVSNPVLSSLRKDVMEILPSINALAFSAQQAISSGTKLDRKVYERNFQKIRNPSESKRAEIISEAWYIQARYEYRMATGYEMLEDTVVFAKLDRKRMDTRLDANEQALVPLDIALRFAEQTSNALHPRALFAKACLEVELSMSDDAVRDFTTLTQSDRLSLEEKSDCHVRIGDIYLSQNNDQGALKNYSEAVKKNAISARPVELPFLRKARQEFKMAKTNECITTCDSGLARLPNSPELYFVKGCALNRKNLQEEAGICFIKAVNRGLSTVFKDSISRISMIYLNAGKEKVLAKNLPGAIESFRHAFLIDRNPEALLHGARAKVVLGMIEEAIADTDTLQRLNPAFKGTALVKGLALMKRNLWEEASDQFSNELKLDKTSQEAIICRAKCNEMTGNFPSALADYELALEIQPIDSVWGQMVYCYFQAGQYAKAIGFAQKKFKMVQKHFNVYFYSGRSRFMLGDLKGARIDYELARQLNPFYTELYWYRGLAFENSGLWDEALAAYYACNKSPQWKDTAIYRSGFVYMQRQLPGDFKRAGSLLESYINQPGSTASCEALAWTACALLKASEKPKALEYLGSSNELCKDVVEMRYVQAVMSASEGREGEALEHLGYAIGKDVRFKSMAMDESVFKSLSKKPEFRKLMQ